jgi:hypothetical protein
MVFEIEIKSLLKKEKYEELLKELPKKCKKIESLSMRTHRFRPHDVRVRFCDGDLGNETQLVLKEGDSTNIERKEISVDLKSEKDGKEMINILEHLGFKEDPSWLKHFTNFEINFKKHVYTLSVQYMENFEYLLEAEVILPDDADKKTKDMHIKNLNEIILSLGLKQIDKDDYNKRIQEYIKKFSEKK